ncbi:MAG: hypothetical protein MUE81_05025 [Thermoflexibacter sp.]|jgi:hypothetical protein|nr:hypothetical protein [Thermoflexibacter sp.]
MDKKIAETTLWEELSKDELSEKAKEHFLCRQILLSNKTVLKTVTVGFEKLMLSVLK